jgi:hypothetical protein
MKWTLSVTQRAVLAPCWFLFPAGRARGIHFHQVCHSVHLYRYVLLDESMISVHLNKMLLELHTLKRIMRRSILTTVQLYLDVIVKLITEHTKSIIRVLHTFTRIIATSILAPPCSSVTLSAIFTMSTRNACSIQYIRVERTFCKSIFFFCD